MPQKADLTARTEQFIAQFEDPSGQSRFRVHDDGAGNATIGIGHRITAEEKRNLQVGQIKLQKSDDKLQVRVETRPTEAKIRQLFKQDVKEAQSAVENHFPGPKTDNQIVALTSFFFNTGPNRPNTAPMLREALASGSPANIATAMTEFSRAGGKTLPGLEKRRNAEASLFVTPDPSEIEETAPGLSIMQQVSEEVANPDTPLGIRSRQVANDAALGVVRAVRGGTEAINRVVR